MHAPEYEFANQEAPLYVWPRVGENNALALQEGLEIRYGVFYEELCKAIKQFANGGLVILDNLVDIFAVDENSKMAANACIKRVLGGLIKKYGCTILLLAHPSKASQANGTYDSGSTAWRNALRNMWALTPHENKELLDYRYIKRTKSNYSAKTEPLPVKWENGRFKSIEAEAIVDEELDRNTEVVYDNIKKQCEKGQRFGSHPSHSLNIYTSGLRDQHKKTIPKEVIRQIVSQLIMDGRIVNITGTSRDNGLWTTEKYGD
jgi:RecA-family ATPase